MARDWLSTLISKLYHFGSNTIGKLIGQAAAARGAKYQLEMGGKNPIIIVNDADLDQAVAAVLSGGLKSNGQKCTCSSRVIVQSGVYNELKEKLLAEVSKIKVGNGLDADTWMGPCASESQYNTVKYYIQKGLEEGAELLIGGDSPESEELKHGFFVNPTVFDKVTPSMIICPGGDFWTCNWH